MDKIAIVILSEQNTGDGLGRIVNALTAAKEYKEAGDKVKVIFSGAGTQWPAALVREDHAAHGLFESVRDVVVGACGYCAGAFQQTAAIQACGIPLLEDFGPNMSYRQLTSEGYRVLNF